MNNIELMCGLDNNVRLLSLSIPENTDPLSTILVGFTGGLDSLFLLYLLATLNSTQTIPYIIQPITLIGSKIASEQRQYINPIIDYINDKTGQSISILIVESTDSLSVAYSDILTEYSSSTLLYLGTTSLVSVLSSGYARNFPAFSARTMQPFKNLDKSHIIDAMIKLNLEDLIDIAPRCTVTHKYGNEACLNYFCTERRWAYGILNRQDLLNKFISKDT